MLKEGNRTMEENVILVCNQSNEGIFSAVYEAYERHLSYANTRIQINDEEEPQLFSKYIQVTADREKASKVAGTVIRRFGMESYKLMLEALASTDPRRAQYVYGSISFGLEEAYKGNLMDCIYQDDIAGVVALSNTTWYELHHFYGFLRFKETKNRTLYAEIRPKNDLLIFMGEHFSNRFCNENFIIYDKIRDICLIHPRKTQWFILEHASSKMEEEPQYSDAEERIQELFCHFCHKIAIKERENPLLQQQMLPLRFREEMIEFQKIG